MMIMNSSTIIITTTTTATTSSRDSRRAMCREVRRCRRRSVSGGTTWRRWRFVWRRPRRRGGNWLKSWRNAMRTWKSSRKLLMSSGVTALPLPLIAKTMIIIIIRSTVICNRVQCPCLMISLLCRRLSAAAATPDVTQMVSFRLSLELFLFYYKIY